MKVQPIVVKSLIDPRSVIFYLGDYHIFLVHSPSKKLQIFLHLLRETLTSKLGNCHHDIEFSLIVFHPAGEGQIYVPVIRLFYLAKMVKVYFLGSSSQGIVIFKFLLQS